MILDGIKWIMFDLDNTLVDFSIASKKALVQTCKDNNLEFNDSFYSTYYKINKKCWEDFEAGIKTAMDIRKERFTHTFDKLGISNIDGFAFNAEYMKHIVQFTEAYDGIIDMLSTLKSNYVLSIVTNGLKEAQRPRMDLVQITKYFDSIIVSDEIGHSKPSSAYFDIAFNSLENNIDKQDILVVGDSLKSDILGANNYGLKSCWVSNGKINDTSILPDHSIEHAVDLIMTR